MISGSGRCFYHPDRAGLGICVECRNVICVECTTQFEGINRCARCLKARLSQVQKIVARSEWGIGNLLLMLLSLGLLFGSIWAIASVWST